MVRKNKYSKIAGSLIITFILGFFAYGYAFTNYTPAHDGTMTVTTDQNWQIALGRVWAPVYVGIRGAMCSPWLIGILTLFFVGIAVFIVVDILDVCDDLWKIFIISALFVLNISNILLATVFMHTFDIYAMSLLLAVASVEILIKYKSKVLSIIISSLLLSFSMGLYQSYFAVTATLFLLVLMKRIMNEDSKINELIALAARELLVMMVGSVFYFVSIRIIQSITNVKPIENYNSVSNVSKLSVGTIIGLIPSCYLRFFGFFFDGGIYATRMLIVVNVLIFITAIISYSYVFNKMKLTYNKVLLLVVVVLFPLGSNCVYIFNSGMMHNLMVFPYQVFYILLLLPIFENKLDKRKILANRVVIGCIALLSMIIIRFSNDILYYQKGVGEGTRANMTNILYDIERCSDFDAANMKIVMIGSPNNALASDYSMKAIYGEFQGIGHDGTTITYDSVFGAYFKYLFGKNFIYEYSEDVISMIEETEEYQSMQVYPKEGYLGVIGDYLVLKFR